MKGKTYIDVTLAEDWKDSERTLRIRMSDTVKYFAVEAQSLSGCRTLAGETGDWRCIDIIAQDCLEYFKIVNVAGLRRESKKWGLVPKF